MDCENLNAFREVSLKGLFSLSRSASYFYILSIFIRLVDGSVKALVDARNKGPRRGIQTSFLERHRLKIFVSSVRFTPCPPFESLKRHVISCLKSTLSCGNFRGNDAKPNAASSGPDLLRDFRSEDASYPSSWLRTAI